APEFVGMTANAALGFVLAGIALIVPALKIRHGAAIRHAIGAVLIGSGLLVLAEIVFHIALRIDFAALYRWLGDSRWPGRMALSTCVGFMLYGMVLILMQHVRTRSIGLGVQIGTFALLLVGLTGLVGYS